MVTAQVLPPSKEASRFLAPRPVDESVDARMHDLEGQSCSVDGVEKLQAGRLTAGLASTQLYGAAPLGNAENGVADNACVVEAPSSTVDGECVIGEIILDGILKAKVVDYFWWKTVVEVRTRLRTAVLCQAGQKQRDRSNKERKWDKFSHIHRMNYRLP